MKKRTSNLSRRVVSLLMSLVLTLTLVTPAAFATEVVGGSGTAIIEGNANPADANPSGDNEGKDDENKDTEHGKDEQPTNLGDEDKNPGEGEGDDANKPDEDKKDEAPDGENKDEENKNEQPTEEPTDEIDTQEGEGTDPVAVERTVKLEKWNTKADYDVRIVVPAATASESSEGENAGSGNETLSTEYTGTDEKITLKLTTEDYTDNPIIYIKSSADEVVAETTPKLGDDGTLEYVFTGEETDITLYYGTKDDFVSAWYGDGSATKYTIRSAEELAYLSALTNGTAKDCHGDSVDPDAFENKFVSLIRDIDLSAYPDWIPIGYGYYDFEGTLDGENHTVTVNMDKRFSDESESDITVGIIGWLNGIVKNLSVAGSITVVNETSNTAYVGAIVGTFGNSAATISQCKNAATIDVDVTVSNANVGGIVGASRQKKYNSNVQGVVNCLNEGNITIHAAADLTVNVAGIMGAGKVGNPISSCWNTGDVAVTVAESANVTSIGGNVAGIAGNNSNITSCANYGRISTPSDFVGSTAGIIGVVYKNKNGLVTNSYNVGDITGNENGLFGIGKVGSKKNQGKIENSYYVCKLNGAEKMAYIYNASEAEVKYNEMDKTYTVGDDTTLLVKTLNDNRGSNTAWFVNHAAGVYFPIHVLSWTGDRREEFGGVTINITYDPNGGMAAGGSTASVTITETLEPDVNTGEWTAASHTVLAVDNEEIGFVNENGEIKETPWNTASDGTGTGYNAGDSIYISDPKSEGITLYAQWDNIWAGSGTEAAPYEIPDVGKLTALQTQVNENGFSYSGKWFRLTNNIDLNNEPWTPIGVDTGHPFSGSLDGGGKTISGLNVNTTKQWAGLFGRVESPVGTAVIMRELTIENGSVKTTAATSWCGGLVAQITGAITLNRVTVKNLTIEGDGIGGTGGLVGGGSAVMTDCRNEGGSVTGRYAGGLAGRGFTNGQDYVFSGCTNSAAVSGGKFAGGMTGHHTDNSSSYTDCANSGAIIASGADGHAAGIANGAHKIENCQNSGAISAVLHACGIGNGVNIEKCSNTGFVNGGVAAGIATGYVLRISFCSNTGAIEAIAGGASAKREYGIFAATSNINCTIKYSFSYVAGKDIALAPNTLAEGKVTNSYYLASSATAVSSAGEYATLADFASGKVAWGVGGKGEGSQGGTDQDAKLGWWKQDKDDKYPTLLDNPDMSKRYYRTDVDCGTGGEVELTRNASSAVKEISSKEAVYGPAGTSVTIKATPKDNTFGLKSLTWTHNGQTDVLPAKGTTNIVMPAESNVTIHAEFASVGPGGNGGYYYGGSGDGTGTGDKDDEGLQDGLNMDVEYDIKGLVLGAYAEWGSNGGNKSFQKWLEENPNVVRALLTNSLDNMATAAVGKKTDEAKDLAALLLASLNEHTGVDGKDGDTIAKALQKYIDSGSEEVFSAWLTGGGGMASGTYESIYGQYASSLAALADRLYSKWEASGTSMTFPVWLDSQQVSMDSLSENADEPDTDNTNDPQTSDAPDDVPDGQDTEGGASGNSVWEIIGTAVRENPIIVWSIVAVVAALVIVGAVRRYHKVKRDERDDNGAE